MKSLQEKQALTVHDAVAVIWMPGAEEPRIRRLRHDTAKAAAGGSILGGLVGLVVLGPVGGAAAGAAVGAVTHRLRSVGINDDVVEQIRNELHAGHLRPARAEQPRRRREAPAAPGPRARPR